MREHSVAAIFSHLGPRWGVEPGGGGGTVVDIFGYFEFVLSPFVKYSYIFLLCVTGEGWIYRNVSKQIIPEKEELFQEQEGLSHSGITINKQRESSTGCCNMMD